MSEVEQAEPIKRKPGRPKKIATAAKPEVAAGAPKTEQKYTFKAKPNWEAFDVNEVDTPDRLHISASLIPDGFDLIWVTDSVYGQSMAQHRAQFERKGWTPCHQSDFNGRFDGMFMPKGSEGEIKNDGLVLMYRPIEFSIKAKKADKKAAMEQVQIKENAWRQGDIGTQLDSRHPSALASNKITRTVERLEIPGDK